MELGKDFDAHEVGFIEDQDGLLFFGDDFAEEASEGFGQEGDGEATRLYLERERRICLRSSRIVPVLAVTGIIRYWEG
jgi:hypothetical protein